MTSTKRPKSAFDDVWASVALPATHAPLKTGAKPLDPALGKAWKPTPEAVEAKKAPKARRNPSVAERIRRDGGLGMSDETKRQYLGTGARTAPLRAVNSAIASVLDIPVGALQLGEHSIGWLADEADDRFKGTEADQAIAQATGVHMRPSEIIGGMAEAFPMGFPEGSGLSVAQALKAGKTGAKGAARLAFDPLAEATSTARRVVGEVLEDTQGAVPRAPKTGAKIKARHYSLHPELTETDPSKWGTNKTPHFLPPEERAAKGIAPDRTWFGLQTDNPYSKEKGTGPYAYEAELDADRYFDANGDRTWLTEQIAELPINQYGRVEYDGKAFTGPSITERLIKDAGYAGYTITDPSLGDVAAAFDPVAVSRVEKPLPGAPTGTRINGERVPFGPYDPLRDLAQDYTSKQGLEYTPPTRYAPVDEAFHTRVADAYEDMPHNPADPDVAEAYDALKSETAAQLQALTDKGYKFTFSRPGEDPYPNPWEAIQDLRDNQRMQVFPTDEGFGTGAAAPSDNPLLELVPGVKWGDKPVTYNDALRAVHDALGHAKEGVGFRGAGENHAYLQHLPTFSPAAQRALATETLGQNSWLNYGPHGATNRTASVADTIFAEQKNGLLPDDLIYGGQAAEFMPDPLSTAYGKRGNPKGRGEARIRDDRGILAALKERGGFRPNGEMRKTAVAPAILKERLPTKPDYGYPVKPSKLRNVPDASDMDIDFEQTRPMAERTILSPEDLAGGTLVANMSDLTRAGGVLKGINGRKWWGNEVNMQGGQDFMREQAANGTGSLWASDKSPISRLMNRARESDEGPVYLTPYTMNAAASDYSHHMSDAVMSQFAVAPKPALAAFDAAFREHYPDFAGTFNLWNKSNEDKLRNQLRGNGPMRSAMVKALDSARWRNAGVADIGMLRQAVNDPRLTKAPTESFGFSVGEIDRSGTPIAGGQVPHETYNTQLPGSYLGGLEAQVPPNIMFPDWWERRKADAGRKRADFGRLLQLDVPTQKTDQKWLDGIMPYMEWAQSTGHLDW